MLVGVCVCVFVCVCVCLCENKSVDLSVRSLALCLIKKQNLASYKAARVSPQRLFGFLDAFHFDLVPHLATHLETEALSC